METFLRMAEINPASVTAATVAGVVGFYVGYRSGEYGTRAYLSCVLPYLTLVSVLSYVGKLQGWW